MVEQIWRYKRNWLFLFVLFFFAVWNVIHYPKIAGYVYHQGLLKSKFSTARSQIFDSLSENFTLFKQKLDEIPQGVEVRILDDNVDTFFFVYDFRGDTFKFLRFRIMPAETSFDGHFTFDGETSSPLAVMTTGELIVSGTRVIQLVPRGSELFILWGENEASIEIERSTGACGLLLYPPEISLKSVSLRRIEEGVSWPWPLRMMVMKTDHHLSILLFITFCLASLVTRYLSRGGHSLLRSLLTGEVGVILWMGMIVLVLFSLTARKAGGGMHPYFIYALQGMGLLWILIWEAITHAVSRLQVGRSKRIFHMGIRLLFILPPVILSVLLVSQAARITRRADGMMSNLKFRDRPAHPPVPGDIVILCMGGSSTEGAPFDPDWPHDYPSLLEKNLQSQSLSVRVFNAGISSASSWTAMKIVPELINKLNPHIVIFSYLENDLLVEHLESLRERLIPDFLLKKIPRKNHHDVIRSLIELCNRNGAIPIFLVEPTFQWIHGGQGDLPLSVRKRYDLSGFPSVRMWDPLPLYREHANDILFMDSVMHQNRWGNRLISDYLAMMILSEILYP